MKKAIPAAVLGMTALLLSGCQNTGSLEYIIGHSDYFDVKVEEVSEDRFRGMSEKLGEVEVLLGGSLNSRSYTDIRAGDLLTACSNPAVPLVAVTVSYPEASRLNESSSSMFCSSSMQSMSGLLDTLQTSFSNNLFALHEFLPLSYMIARKNAIT